MCSHRCRRHLEAEFQEEMDSCKQMPTLKVKLSDGAALGGGPEGLTLHPPPTPTPDSGREVRPHIQRVPAPKLPEPLWETT